MTLKELMARIGEGNFPWAAFKEDDCQGVACAAGHGDTLFDVALVPVVGDLEPGDIKLDDWNADCIAYLVHCVNNFGPAVEALREALTQLDDYNAETRETSRWAEWHSTLAAAQTIPSGEARKCAKCGFNISEYAVGEILCGACLNDQPCALCGHRYEAHEPDMQCHDGEAHGNRCACRTFVPSGEKEGK